MHCPLNLYKDHADIPAIELISDKTYLNDLIFAVGTHGKNHHFLDANYSIKHNSKVLIEDILDIDMCLRKQNL